MRASIFVLLLLLVGCTTGRELALGPEYAPLTRVEEGTEKLFSKGLTTTIAHTCYVGDLKTWVADNPCGGEAPGERSVVFLDGSTRWTCSETCLDELREKGLA